jgi:hypothetical protein
MVPISFVGVFTFFLIFISAPVGIICGVIGARKGNNKIGILGTSLNGLLLVAVLVFWILAATPRTD